MKKSGWIVLPAAFFLIVNYSISSVKVLFFSKLLYFLFLITLFFFLRKFDISKMLKILVGGISLIIFSYGLIQKFVLFPIYLNHFKPGDNFYSQAIIERIKSGRIFSLFRLPTLYAIICAVLILFIFHYLLKSSKNKTYWSLLLVLGLINLVLTQSFGGLIYLSVGILIYLLLLGILKFKYLAPILMIFFLFFSITIALRYSEAKKLSPITLRFSNWIQAARAISSSPFWGVGLGNYESMVSYFTRSDEAKSIYAHNFFLQFFAETGVIVPFFLILSLIFSRKKLKPENPGETETVLYVSVFFILLTYNLIDIGFYFFSAGIAAVIVLSQLYPYPVGPDRYGNKRKIILNLAVLTLLSALLVVEAVSENYRIKGDLLLDQNDYIEAEMNYKKSSGINPFNFKVMMKYGFMNYFKNNAEEAEKYLDRTLNLYPDSSYAHYWKSKIEANKGHLMNAFFHASHAYRKNPLDSRYRTWYVEIKNYLETSLKQVNQ
jgi:tetratricopeptide (TPR) repeat protein